MTTPLACYYFRFRGLFETCKSFNTRYQTFPICRIITKCMCRSSHSNEKASRHLWSLFAVWSRWNERSRAKLSIRWPKGHHLKFNLCGQRSCTCWQTGNVGIDCHHTAELKSSSNKLQPHEKKVWENGNVWELLVKVQTVQTGLAAGFLYRTRWGMSHVLRLHLPPVSDALLRVLHYAKQTYKT